MPANRIAVPKSIKESSGPRGTVIERYWHPGWPRVIAVGAFTLIWDAFLWAWFDQAFRGPHGINWIAILIVSGHLGVGIALTYYILSLLLNRTEYRVTDSELVIRSGPMPMFGNRTIPTDEITQLFVTEDLSTDSYGEPRANYEMHMIDREGNRERIFKGLNDAHEALFLENRLEALMGIEARSVVGACEDLDAGQRLR